MLKRKLLLLPIIYLAICTLWAASDPFVGKWKVNPSRSKLTDEMKVEALEGNKYAITFAPGQVDTVITDGTDQPALQGTTLSITVEGPNNWKVTRKTKEGRPVIIATWTLSSDGQTLDDAFTGYQQDGPPIKLHYTYQRTSGSSGFPGTWDSLSAELDSAASIELEIQSYESDGLSFSSRGLPMDQKTKLDGKDHASTNPNARPGSTYSGRRASQRSLEITGKLQGKITSTQQFEVSTDLKTLTFIVRLAGEKEPRTILVFDRE